MHTKLVAVLLAVRADGAVLAFFQDGVSEQEILERCVENTPGCEYYWLKGVVDVPKPKFISAKMEKVNVENPKFPANTT